MSLSYVCMCVSMRHCEYDSFFFQAEDGIRDLVRSRGLGDVYKRQSQDAASSYQNHIKQKGHACRVALGCVSAQAAFSSCLLYTSDAADERSSVDLGGRRIIKKKNQHKRGGPGRTHANTTTGT